MLPGYQVYAVRGSAASYDPERLEKWWHKKNCLFLFQPFKSFDDILPNKRGEQSDSIRFLVEICNQAIPGYDHNDPNKLGYLRQPVLYRLFTRMARIIVLKCRAGFISLPLLTDSEVEEDLEDKMNMNFDSDSGSDYEM